MVKKIMGQKEVIKREKIAREIWQRIYDDYLNILLEKKDFGEREQEQVWLVCEAVKMAIIPL